jgi:hypothetical protein
MELLEGNVTLVTDDTPGIGRTARKALWRYPMNMLAHRRFFVPALVGAALLGAGPAMAQELREGQAAITQLAPNASAVTYFVDRPDGYHIIVTVRGQHDARADALHQSPVVRFTSRIAPGQTIDVSLPETSGSPSTVMEITRRAGSIAIETKQPAVVADE